MPRPGPVLTDAQRTLYAELLGRGILAGYGSNLDSASFGRNMLHPEYVEMARKFVAPKETWLNPQDSAGFYDTYRSPFAMHAPYDGNEVPKPTISSSREGVYDTIRSPAFGDIPAQERVEFRPSVNQRVRDGLESIGGIGRKLAEGIGKLEMPDAPEPGYARKLLEGMAPADKLRRLYEFARPDTLDALTTNGVPPRRTK